MLKKNITKKSLGESPPRPEKGCTLFVLFFYNILVPFNFSEMLMD